MVSNKERWTSSWRNKFGWKRIWKALNFRQKFQRPWDSLKGLEGGSRNPMKEAVATTYPMVAHTSSCGNPRQDWVGEGEATGSGVCLFAAWWRAKETGEPTGILRLLALKQEEWWCRWQKQRTRRPAWGWGRGEYKFIRSEFGEIVHDSQGHALYIIHKDFIFFIALWQYITCTN